MSHHTSSLIVFRYQDLLSRKTEILVFAWQPHTLESISISFNFQLAEKAAPESKAPRIIERR